MALSGHVIKKVDSGSIAEEVGIEPGMALLQVNGREIRDVFDYPYLISDELITVLIRDLDGSEVLVEIEKDPGEDLGIEFGNALMDGYRSCSNKCIFCFIDQMPPGMRETLYFKDDDSRLSFLQGNYITMTNMSDRDIDRIIEYRMEPINVSVHTTDPELRVRMLKNRRAGDIFPKMRRLKEAGITMNGQIVLCRGWNDGDQLDKSIGDLMEFMPEMRSLSVVPSGVTKYRDGLEKLLPFDREAASDVIDRIERWQREALRRTAGDEAFDDGGPRHFVHASDEWYVLAERELPELERYDGFPQYENGVGMMRLFIEESGDAVRKYAAMAKSGEIEVPSSRKTVCATGKLAGPFIKEIIGRAEAAFPGIKCDVADIRNDFFGESITVSGLVTGGDLIRQIKVRPAAEELLIPVNMLRSGEEVFLDDVTVTEVREALGMSVRVTDGSGEDLIRSFLGLPKEGTLERQIYEQTDSSYSGQA